MDDASIIEMITDIKMEEYCKQQIGYMVRNSWRKGLKTWKVVKQPYQSPYCNKPFTNNRTWLKHQNCGADTAIDSIIL